MMFTKTLRLAALISIFAFGFMFTNAAVVMAQESNSRVDDRCDGSSSLLGFPTWYKYLEVKHTPEKGCEILMPQTTNADGTESVDIGGVILPILAAIVEILLRIIGLAAVVFVIYGGVQFVISQGEPEQIKNARTTIFNALIGLVIAIFASVIVNLIARSI